MSTAAFTAVFSDWKVIKTRACVQIVFELPIEKADDAYQVLGGMPVAAKEVWCGIARLGAQAITKERRSFAEMSPAQQAGMLCDDVAFRRYLEQRVCTPCTTVEQAAEIVRDYCEVHSRSEITKDNQYWSEIVNGYRSWQREAEVVPA